MGLNDNIYLNKGILKFLNKDPLEIKFLKGGQSGKKMIHKYDDEDIDTINNENTKEQVNVPMWADENTLKSNHNIHHSCLNKSWPQELTYNIPKQLLSKIYLK